MHGNIDETLEKQLARLRHSLSCPILAQDDPEFDSARRV